MTETEKMVEQVDRDWLLRQLRMWPERTDQARTINIQFLMKAAAEEIDRLQSTARAGVGDARVAGLVEALKACLARETERAKYAGLADCCCVNVSREAEREYDLGECPHQKARAALATFTQDKEDGR